MLNCLDRFKLLLLSVKMILTTEEAEKEYGAENIKIYKSTFVPMYYALMDADNKVKCSMKLVCLGPEEKVHNELLFDYVLKNQNINLILKSEKFVPMYYALKDADN